MREKVAVATVEGKAYYLIVNQLREHNVPFISLIPGETVPAQIKVVITTEKEKPQIRAEKTVVFQYEGDLDALIVEVERELLGKVSYEQIVIGIDPGEVTGLAVLADGKVVEAGNCYSTQEVINSINQQIKNVNHTLTSVTVKVGDGVLLYRDLLEVLDEELPREVVFEVVGEAGTNKPLNRRSRGIRHISSAIRIAGRLGRKYQRRKTIATNSRIQQDTLN